MVSTMMLFYVGAAGAALVCFVVGFLLGKSNLKSKVEHALEEGRGALDAREFAMRQQLEDALSEAARLRPLAQDYDRVQDRLRAEQSQYNQMKADFDASLKSGPAAESGKSAPKTEQKMAPPPVSADEAVQKLMQSLELTMKGPGEPNQAPSQSAPVIEKQSPVVTEQPPAPRVQTRAVDEPPPTPRVQPKPIVDVQPKIEPKASKPVELGAPAEDEWQEFARSLADLTRRNP